MKKILITGITGQDGLFLCKELSQLDENYQIYGISRKRNLSSFYKKLESLNIKNNLPISITNVNLLSYTDVLNFIEQIKPQYCYNLSGPSSVYEYIKNRTSIF